MDEENKENIKISKVRIWQLISGVLLLALIISLFTGVFKGNVTGEVISSSDAGNSLVKYLNAQTGGGLSYISSKDIGNLYEITVSYQGQNIPVYVTKDGEYFIQNIAPLSGEVATDSPTAQANPRVDVDMETLIDDDAIKGNIDAPVTMVEFSDYECPFCGRHYSQTYSQIIKEYVDTGKVRLVYRDFPLDFHPNAQKAAEAAECFKEQKGDEGYWKYHDRLFENQDSLSEVNYKKWAKELGADSSKFDTCLDSGKMASEVAKDLQDGQVAGISGTPGFIINGKLVSGAQPFSAFKQIIEQELNN